MLYSLYLYIISNNAGRLNAVENILPANGSAGIWAGGYEVRREKDDMGINDVLVANIDFYGEEDMKGVWNSLRAIDGIIKGCLEGSYLIKYNSNHKWNEEHPDDIRTCEIIERETPDGS